MDFSEFETAGQGVWNLGGIVDYAAKLALGCPISTTKTARDAIAALELARDHAGDLLGRSLLEDCTFLDDYNHRRPHEVIAFALPIDAYLADQITPVQTRQNAAEP